MQKSTARTLHGVPRWSPGIISSHRPLGSSAASTLLFQQALSIGVGLAAAIGLRMLSHWWLTRLRE
jgi:hypothetical protein